MPMQSEDVIKILEGFESGEFSEPAAILERAIRTGAKISESPAPIAVSEMLPRYDRRDAKLRELGMRTPGHSLVVNLMSKSPDAQFFLVGIILPRLGGALFLSADRVPLACFAYDDEAASEFDE